MGINTSGMQQRSRVRRLCRRPTPLRGVFFHSNTLCVQQYLVRLTTIACAVALPPPYGAPELFQVQSSEISANNQTHQHCALYVYVIYKKKLFLSPPKKKKKKKKKK